MEAAESGDVVLDVEEGAGARSRGRGMGNWDGILDERM